MQHLQEARSELLKAIMLCTAMSGCVTDIIDIKERATDMTVVEMHKIANVLNRIGACADELSKVMTTALNEGRNVTKAFELGCVAYAGKPIDQEKFENVLRKLELI